MNSPTQLPDAESVADMNSESSSSHSYIQGLPDELIDIISHNLDTNGQQQLSLVSRRFRSIVCPTLFQTINVYRQNKDVKHFSIVPDAQEQMLKFANSPVAKFARKMSVVLNNDAGPVQKLPMDCERNIGLLFASIRTLDIQVVLSFTGYNTDGNIKYHRKRLIDYHDGNLDETRIVAQANLNQVLRLSKTLTRLTFSRYDAALKDLQFSLCFDDVYCPQLENFVIEGTVLDTMNASPQVFTAFILRHATTLKYIKFCNIWLEDSIYSDMQADWEHCLTAIVEGCRLDAVEFSSIMSHGKYIKKAFESVCKLAAVQEYLDESGDYWRWNMRWESEERKEQNQALGVRTEQPERPGSPIIGAGGWFEGVRHDDDEEDSIWKSGTGHSVHVEEAAEDVARTEKN